MMKQAALPFFVSVWTPYCRHFTSNLRGLRISSRTPGFISHRTGHGYPIQRRRVAGMAGGGAGIEQASPDSGMTGAATGPGETEISEEVEYPTLLFTVVARDAEAAIKFYEEALGGTTKQVYKDDSGKILHSVLVTKYGLTISVNDYFESERMVKPAEVGGGAHATGSFNYITVPKGEGSVDSCVERMRETGAAVISEPADTFYGHRIGRVVDTYGVGWVFAEAIEDE